MTPEEAVQRLFEDASCVNVPDPRDVVELVNTQRTLAYQDGYDHGQVAGVLEGAQAMKVHFHRAGVPITQPEDELSDDATEATVHGYKKGWNACFDAFNSYIRRTCVDEVLAEQGRKDP